MDAARRCLASGMAFAVIVEPGADAARFFACSEPRELSWPVDGPCFIAARWGRGAEQRPVMIPECDPDGAGVRPVPRQHGTNDTAWDSVGQTLPEPTAREDYLRQLRGIVAGLAGHRKKVVISRVKRVDASAREPFEVAADYFARFPQTFRALYHLPGMGLWIVATPERLLSHCAGSSTFETMALAGTRAACSAAEWDRKNVMEHSLVTDHITDVLSRHGLHCTVGPAEELGFGSIEHLCHRIVATGSASPLELALELSPTPALCGWPVDEAWFTIAATERHSRGCYGSFIGTASPSGMDLMVNLRCCMAAPSASGEGFDYALFGGGGINALSVPEDEWNEAEAKMKPLLEKIHDF